MNQIDPTHNFQNLTSTEIDPQNWENDLTVTPRLSVN